MGLALVRGGRVVSFRMNQVTSPVGKKAYPLSGRRWFVVPVHTIKGVDDHLQHVSHVIKYDDGSIAACGDNGSCLRAYHNDEEWAVDLIETGPHHSDGDADSMV